MNEHLVVEPRKLSSATDTRHEAPAVAAFRFDSTTDCEAYERVLRGADATVPKRDAVDSASNDLHPTYTDIEVYLNGLAAGAD